MEPNISQPLNKPKKPPNGFQLFIAEQRKITKCNLEQMSKAWGMISESEKHKYSQMAEAEKCLYQKQMEDNVYPAKHQATIRQAREYVNDAEEREYPTSKIKAAIKECTSCNIQKDALLAIKKLAEVFVIDISKSVQECAARNKRKTMLLQDLLAVVNNDEKYSFLLDSKILESNQETLDKKPKDINLDGTLLSGK